MSKLYVLAFTDPKVLRILEDTLGGAVKVIVYNDPDEESAPEPIEVAPTPAAEPEPPEAGPATASRRLGLSRPKKSLSAALSARRRGLA